MTETTITKDNRPLDPVKASTSQFVINPGADTPIESASDSETFDSLTRPGPLDSPSSTQSPAPSPFLGYKESLTALITDETSGQLFDRTQLVSCLERFGSLDRGLGAVNINYLTSELQRHSECSRNEAAQFCAELLKHYDIRSVVLNMERQTDLALLAAIPERPSSLFIRVQSTDMLSSKSGSQSAVVTAFIDAKIDLTELKTFGFGAHSNFNNSKTLISAGLLIKSLSEAQQLTTLSLNKCDLTGASGAAVLGKLENLTLRNSKCAVEDLEPLVRAQVVDLSGTNMGEDRGLLGFFQRGRLGDALAKHFTSERSRLTELTLPELMLNTNVCILQTLKSGGAEPKKIELRTVNSSGVPDTGNHRQVLMERETHFPNLPSPNNNAYERFVRWFNQ